MTSGDSVDSLPAWPIVGITMIIIVNIIVLFCIISNSSLSKPHVGGVTSLAKQVVCQDLKHCNKRYIFPSSQVAVGYKLQLMWLISHVLGRFGRKECQKNIVYSIDS